MPSLSIGQEMFHATISDNPIQKPFFLKELYPQCGEAGKFQIDLSRKFGFNRYSPRNGVWTTPWPLKEIPGYEMPVYDANFSKSFSEVSDSKAVEIQNMLINDPEQKIALYYSGGMDSLLILVALLKTLTESQLAQLTICTSMDSVIEYPAFFEKYIYNKIKIIDLKEGKIRYSDLWNLGYRVITGDSGDAMFGTEVATQFYYSYKNYCKNLSGENITKLGNLLSSVDNRDIHYSVFADILIQYFGLRQNPNFGRLYYEKLVRLANTSQYPVHSLHDFMWQIIFNIKWMHCAARGPLFFGERENHKESLQVSTINWYQTDDYQKWSMANNNTGEKIRGITSATYKWAARKYIFEFTNDPWYMHFKIKLASLPKIGPTSVNVAIDVGIRFGIDTNYDMLRFTDPGVKDYVTHHLTSYALDW